MRVVHVDSAHEWRGSQNQVLLTAQGMAARGHRVVLACQAGGGLASRAGDAGLPVRPLVFGGDLSLAAILRLTWTFREERPDLVHAHDPHATSAALIAARLAGGRPLVASRRVALPLRGRLSLRKYAACDRVIAVSAAVRQVLLRHGLRADRVSLVADGVPDRSPQPVDVRLLEAFGIPAGSPLIGNVAALTPHKDHATLLAAMPSVLSAVPQARLVIVGAGELRGALEAQVRARGLAGRCIFTGFRSDVDRLLPAFSLVCLSSSTEGLGSSLLDAMCFGRAVVATATGGIPEVVSHGETGLLVPVGDHRALAEALRELLLAPERCAALGRAGRARFEQRFGVERMIDETLRIYGQLEPVGSRKARLVESRAARLGDTPVEG